MKTGNIELEKFQIGAASLCRVLQEDKGGEDDDALLQWSIERYFVDESIVFLKHPPVYSVCRNTSCCPDDGATADHANMLDESLLVEDPDVECEKPNEHGLEWSFSIIYSETWNVPVLYFNVFQGSRIPCQREDVLEILKDETVKDTWQFLSYDEHPVTGVPSLFLHPCRTKERMSQLLKDDDDTKPEEHLWSWMSLILPTVGFPIPSKTFLRVRQKLRVVG